MEAKDTVISDEKLRGLQDEGLAFPDESIILQRDTAQVQAEITASIFYEEGKRAGIREVVEYIKQENLFIHPDKLKEWGV